MSLQHITILPLSRDPWLRALLRQINLFIDAINSLGYVSSVPTSVTGVSSYTILSTDSILLINNTSGSSFPISPLASPATNQIVTIKDAGLTAGAHAFTFVGTIDGEVNPTLVDVKGGSTKLYFSGGSVYRLDV
jgi:hypothetical protein